jgi:hypothetical protein
MSSSSRHFRSSSDSSDSFPVKHGRHSISDKIDDEFARQELMQSHKTQIEDLRRRQEAEKKALQHSLDRLKATHEATLADVNARFEEELKRRRQENARQLERLDREHADAANRTKAGNQRAPKHESKSSTVAVSQSDVSDARADYEGQLASLRAEYEKTIREQRQRVNQLRAEGQAELRDLIDTLQQEKDDQLARFQGDLVRSKRTRHRSRRGSGRRFHLRISPSVGLNYYDPQMDGQADRGSDPDDSGSVTEVAPFSSFPVHHQRDVFEEMDRSHRQFQRDQEKWMKKMRRQSIRQAPAGFYQPAPRPPSTPQPRRVRGVQYRYEDDDDEEEEMLSDASTDTHLRVFGAALRKAEKAQTRAAVFFRHVRREMFSD